MGMTGRKLQKPGTGIFKRQLSDRCGYIIFSLFVFGFLSFFCGCTSPTRQISEKELARRISPPPESETRLPLKKINRKDPSGSLSSSSGSPRKGEPLLVVEPGSGKDETDRVVTLDAPSPPSEVLSLNRAVMYAKKNNPRLRVLRERMNQARAGKRIAFSAFLPEAVISYRALWGTENFVLPTVPTLLGNMAFGETADRFQSAELNVQWVVWDFGRTPGQYHRAEAEKDISELQYERGIQTVVFNTTAAYLNLLQKKALCRVAEDAVRRAISLLRDAKNYQAQGTAVLNDVLQAELLLAEMQLARVRAKTAETIALAALNRVMGFQVSGHTEIADVTTRPVFSLSLKDCLQKAVDLRKEFRSVLKAINASEWGVAASKAQFLPRIIAGGTGAHHGGSASQDDYFLAGGVKIEFSLFEGTRRYGEMERSRAEMREAMARAEEMADGIAFEVIVAFAGIAEAREGISYSQTAVARGSENLKVLRHLLDEGDATATDVIDAEWALLRARENYYTALYQYWTALAQLHYAMGESGPETG